MLAKGAMIGSPHRLRFRTISTLPGRQRAPESRATIPFSLHIGVGDAQPPQRSSVLVSGRGTTARHGAGTRRATFRDLRPPGRQHAPENRSDESAFSFLGDAGYTPPPSKPSVSATDRGTTAGPVSDRGVRDISLLSGPVADSAPTKRLATTAAERPRPPPATPVAMQRARRRACSR